MARDEEKPVVARNAFYLAVGQVTTTALAIMLNAALGRFLGPAEFGRYYLIFTMCAFVYVFVQWAQPLFVIPQVARNPARAGDLLGTAISLRVGFALVATILAWPVGWALGYDVRTRWLSVLFVLGSLPLSLAQSYGIVFQACDRMGREAVVSGSSKALMVGIAVPTLAAGAGIPGVVVAHAVAGAAAMWIGARLYERLRLTPLRVSLQTAKELLQGGAPLLLMTATVAVQPYIDAVILSRLVPATVVGWFGAARTILGTLIAPATILSTAVYPRLSRASVDTTALRGELRSALRPLLWLAGLAAVGTYLFAGTAVAVIYGSSGFGPAATILKVFAPAMLLLFIDMLLSMTVCASTRPTGLVVAKILSVVAGTVLDILLIPLFQEHYGNGGIGVVVSFALSEFCVFAGVLIVLRPGTLEPAMALDVARALGAGSLSLLVFHLVGPVAPWIGIPLCVAAFGLASFALGLLRQRDFAVLQSLVWRHSRAAAVGDGDSPTGLDVT